MCFLNKKIPEEGGLLIVIEEITIDTTFYGICRTQFSHVGIQVPINTVSDSFVYI